MGKRRRVRRSGTENTLLVDVATYCEIYQISRHTAYRDIKAGKVKAAQRPGGGARRLIRIPREDVSLGLETAEVQAGGPVPSGVYVALKPNLWDLLDKNQCNALSVYVWLLMVADRTGSTAGTWRGIDREIGTDTGWLPGPVGRALLRLGALGFIEVIPNSWSSTTSSEVTIRGFPCLVGGFEKAQRLRNEVTVGRVRGRGKGDP